MALSLLDLPLAPAAERGAANAVPPFIAAGKQKRAYRNLKLQDATPPAFKEALGLSRQGVNAQLPGGPGLDGYRSRTPGYGAGMQQLAGGGKVPVKKNNPPVLTGTYTTKTNVQPQRPEDRNASYAYLQQFKTDPVGKQQAYANAINDITHPVTNKPVTYAQIKAELAGQNARAIYNSPAYQRGNYANREAYLDAVFTQGQQRLMQRAEAEPWRNVFEPATAAVDAERRQRTIEGAQVGAYDPSNPLQANAAYRQFQQQAAPAAAVSVAPGMALRRAKGGKLPGLPGKC